MARPVRMCAGCRQRADQGDLVRIVAREGVGTVDPTRTAPGRGVYLHPRAACLDQAVKRRTIGRLLRAEIDGPRTAEAIRDHLDAVVEHQAARSSTP